MWSPRTHSTNLNGPVPTGWRVRSFPHFWWAAGLTRAVALWARLFRKKAKGTFRVKRTVDSSTTSTDLMMGVWRLALRGFSGPRKRSKLYFTASALNGVPSWNLTPFRSLKVQVSASLDWVQLVAKSGLSLSLASNRTRKLFIIRPIASPVLLSVLAGSRLSGSAPAAYTRVPPTWGWPWAQATDAKPTPTASARSTPNHVFLMGASSPGCRRVGPLHTLGATHCQRTGAGDALQPSPPEGERARVRGRLAAFQDGDSRLQVQEPPINLAELLVDLVAEALDLVIQHAESFSDHLDV